MAQKHFFFDFFGYFLLFCLFPDFYPLGFFFYYAIEEAITRSKRKDVEYVEGVKQTHNGKYNKTIYLVGDIGQFLAVFLGSF